MPKPSKTALNHFLILESQAKEFAQQLANLLGYEVWVAMDEDGLWHVLHKQCGPYSLVPVLGYWGFDESSFPCPSLGSPSNWEKTLVHAVPGKDDFPNEIDFLAPENGVI